MIIFWNSQLTYFKLCKPGPRKYFELLIHVRRTMKSMEKWVECIGEYWVYEQMSRGYLECGQITKGYQALLAALKATDFLNRTTEGMYPIRKLPIYFLFPDEDTLWEEIKCEGWHNWTCSEGHNLHLCYSPSDPPYVSFNICVAIDSQLISSHQPPIPSVSLIQPLYGVAARCSSLACLKYDDDVATAIRHLYPVQTWCSCGCCETFIILYVQ